MKMGAKVERWLYKPGISEDKLGLAAPTPGRGRKGPHPEPSGEPCQSHDFKFWALELLGINFCCFKPPSFW